MNSRKEIPFKDRMAMTGSRVKEKLERKMGPIHEFDVSFTKEKGYTIVHWENIIYSIDSISTLWLPNQQQAQGLREEKYEITGNHRGRVLLVNIFSYISGTKETRYGSEMDVHNLTALWREMGHLVEPFSNLTKEDFEKNVLPNFINRVKEDCCTIIIMSHGNKLRSNTQNVCIKMHDNNYVESDWIYQRLNCLKLKGKPKLVFIGTCRVEPQKDEATAQILKKIEVMNLNNTDRVSNLYKDYLFVYPCNPGSPSGRNEQTGSLFFQEMIKVFQQYASTNHLMELLNKVNRNLFDLCSKEGYVYQTVTICAGGFDRNLYLKG